MNKIIISQFDLLHEPDALSDYQHYSQYLIVTNDTVAPLYLDTMLAQLPADKCHTLTLPDGETHKNIEHYQRIIDCLIAQQCDRDSCIVTLGGGVITDIGGFAAATYCRGIHLIHVPTTLLAQVDAAIGSKTAINHPTAKNLIGAFYPADAVLIDGTLIKSLPANHMQSGMAEVVKAACIKDASFFDWLVDHQTAIQQQDANTLQAMINRAIQIKRTIVAADPLENGERRLLNFGHTLGHAIEKASDYQILHGEAVSIGMCFAARLSEQYCNLPHGTTEKIQQYLKSWQLPIEIPQHLSHKSLLNALKLDKKSSNSRIKVILLRQLGQATWHELTAQQLIASL